MAWLDALSAALTAGTTGAAGWLEGQRKGQLEADARAKELFEQLRQKRRDEQERLYQQAQMDRWQREDQRQKEQDLRQGQRDVMEAQDAGYRPAEPFQPTGFASDEPFKALADAQANNAVTLGGRRFVAPLESSRAHNDRLIQEQRKYQEQATKEQNAFVAQQNALNRAVQQDREDWVPAGVDKTTGEPLVLNKRTGETKVGGGIKTGAAGSNERAGMAAAFLGRLNIGKADFDNALTFVRDFHDKLKSGEIKIEPWMTSLASAAQTTPSTEAHGGLGAVNNAIGGYLSGAANKTLSQTAADYARYVNLITAISTAITEVMPRPNQALLGIERGISTARAGDTPERINDIQHRIDAVYNTLFKNPQQLFQRSPSAGTPANDYGDQYNAILDKYKLAR